MTGKPFAVLTKEKIREIDNLLKKVSPYGELHLTVLNSQVQIVQIVESHNAWEPLRPRH